MIISHMIETNSVQFDRSKFHFLWVTDFPLFSPDLKDKSDPGQLGSAGIRSTHHPFTAPNIDDLQYLNTDPLAVRGQHYDLVVNGVELGGGSVRIHDVNLQRFVLEHVLKVISIYRFLIIAFGRSYRRFQSPFRSLGEWMSSARRHCSWLLLPFSI
jgi:aspartyl-tRNA synthetase